MSRLVATVALAVLSSVASCCRNRAHRQRKCLRRRSKCPSWTKGTMLKLIIKLMLAISAAVPVCANAAVVFTYSFEVNVADLKAELTKTRSMNEWGVYEIWFEGQPGFTFSNLGSPLPGADGWGAEITFADWGYKTGYYARFFDYESYPGGTRTYITDNTDVVGVPYLNADTEIGALMPDSAVFRFYVSSADILRPDVVFSLFTVAMPICPYREWGNDCADGGSDAGRDWSDFGVTVTLKPKLDHVVPEPSGFGLLALGLAVFAAIRRRPTSPGR